MVEKTLITNFLYSYESSKMTIEPSITAAYAASVLTRRCAAQAYEKHQRSTVTTNLIEEINFVFRNSTL